MAGKKGKHKVRNSYGPNEYYYYYRHLTINMDKCYKVGPLKYHAIVRFLIRKMREELTETGIFILPFRMGMITIYIVDDIKAYFDKDNKIVLPKVNWAETQKLWNENEEDRKDKILMREAEPMRVMVGFRGGPRHFNMRSMLFSAQREFITELYGRIKNGKKYPKKDTEWLRNIQL